MSSNLGSPWISNFTGLPSGYYSNGMDIESKFYVNPTPVVTTTNTSIINDLFLSSGITPWGIYDAKDWNLVTNVLPEARGQTAKNATSTGIITYSAGASGNGASASIPSISGGTSSILSWPIGSWPSNFTICGIIRHTGAIKSRLFTGTRATGSFTSNMYLGFGQGYNFAYWDTPRSPIITPETTNWLVCCAKNGLNGGIPANTVLRNGVAIGTTNGSGQILNTGTGSITINGYSGNESQWEFTYLIIYDSVLTDTQMMAVSAKLQNYLVTGTMTGV